MFGTVLAMVKMSACSDRPSAAASRVDRTKPLSRDTTVPAAITALEARMPACSLSGVGGEIGSGSVTSSSPAGRQRVGGRVDHGQDLGGSAAAAHPAEQPDQDRQEQQADTGADDQPDHHTDLGRTDRQLVGLAERVAVDVGEGSG